MKKSAVETVLDMQNRLDAAEELIAAMKELVGQKADKKVKAKRTYTRKAKPAESAGAEVVTPKRMKKKVEEILKGQEAKPSLHKVEI